MRSLNDVTALERDAWRAVAQHLDLAEVLAAVTQLVPALSRASWSVRRVLLDPPQLETMAHTGGGPSPGLRVPLDAIDGERLAALGEGDRLGAWPAGDGATARRLIRCGRNDTALLLFRLAERPFVLLQLEGDLIDVDAAADALQVLLPPLRVALAHDQKLHELVRRREAVEAENRALLSRLGRGDISASIVGATTGLRDVLERVDQVAPTEVPVLILGETGSGKEVVARAIHTRSKRATGPFLRVNCGAIPLELVDSELFGHERGSFTGAVAARKGWFERADGGTLFLDEVGELPHAAQVRLLRVLQDGGFERVGGQHGMVADVRVVAATHRDMGEMIASGSFREDLWYRLSVFPIVLPPLRQRREDIVPLARHFASAAGARLHGVPLHPSAEDLAPLVAYDWPGNVRELAAVIERAAILGGGMRLDVERALGGATPIARTPKAETTTPAVAELERGSLESVTRAAIEHALRLCRGRIEGSDGAAIELGVHPATLRSRMRKLGIDWKQFRSRPS